MTGTCSLQSSETETFLCHVLIRGSIRMLACLPMLFLSSHGLGTVKEDGDSHSPGFKIQFQGTLSAHLFFAW